MTFIAAISDRHRPGGVPVTLGLLMVIVINMAFVWLPFLAYLAAPGLTAYADRLQRGSRAGIC